MLKTHRRRWPVNHTSEMWAHLCSSVCARWLLAEHLDKESNTVRVYFFPGWGNSRAALTLMWEPGICPQWPTGWGDGTARVPAPCSAVMGTQVGHLYCLLSFVHRAGKKEGADLPQGPAPTSALSAALAEWPGLHRSTAWRWVTASLPWEQERGWQQAWELGPSDGVHVQNRIIIPSPDHRGRSSDRRQWVSPPTYRAWASTPQVEAGGPEGEHGGKNRPLNMMEHLLKTCTWLTGSSPLTPSHVSHHQYNCRRLHLQGNLLSSDFFPPQPVIFFSFLLWSWHYFKTYNLWGLFFISSNIIQFQEGRGLSTGEITHGGSVVKDSLANAGDTGDLDSFPGLGRSPGEGNGNPLQYSCLENPMDWGAWWATFHRITKSWTWLSMHAL